MGQRHQLFVIANVNGRYRTLCAIHHQWLYGHTALRRCLDTLNIFGDAANRAPIQQELRAASKKDDSFWVATRSQYHEKNNHVPFPFIATCLIVGASFNLDGYFHSVMIEPFYMEYDGGDNNNGITIFDITELSDVRYCFVDFMGMESERAVALMTPLSARTYLEAYYDLNESDGNNMWVLLLQSFEGRNKVSTATLKNTWPNGNWQDSELVDEGPEISIKPAESIGLKDAVSDHSKTLRDQSMDTLLESLIDEPQDISQLISEAELMVDFIPKLRLKLYANAASLKRSTNLLHLIKKALENEPEVDLSPFLTLTPDDLYAVVAELRKGKMEVLNLSNMPSLTETDLEKILELGIPGCRDMESEVTTLSSAGAADAKGYLKALVLLENHQISLDFLGQKLGNYDVYHSDLFRRTIFIERLYVDETAHPKLEFVAPNIVSQLIWIGISSGKSYDPHYRRDHGQIDWQTLEYSRKPSRSMASAKSLGFKHYPLDIPLPATKMTQCLMRLLQFLTSPKITWHQSWSEAAARCFASVSPRTIAGGHGIGPLSFTLCRSTDNWGRDSKALDAGPLRKGQWAIILIHEAFDVEDQKKLEQDAEADSQFGVALKEHPEIKPVKRLRYVLAKVVAVSGPSQKRFLVTDVPGYLDHVLGGAEGNHAAEVKETSELWKETISGIGGEVSYYDDEDIYEILEKVYATDKAAVKDEPFTTSEAVDDMMAKIFSMQSLGK